MLGVFANVITILIGSALGMLFRKGISKKVTNSAMAAIGLCCLCIGVNGMLEGKDTIVLVTAMVVGTIIGAALDIDSRLNNLNNKTNFKNASSNVIEGFITASLVFCVGSMTILGGLDAGLKNDNTVYYTKAILDLISSAMLTTSLGIGVVFSAGTVFIYQGALVLLATILAPYLTANMVAELNCAGSLMIFALGMNLCGISKFKIANFLPAIIIVPVICILKGLF